MNKRAILFLLSAFIPWASFAAESQLNPATSWGDSLIRTQRGRGHPGDKAAIMSGDVITGLAGRGYTGSAFTTADGISIELQASEDWTGAAQGTKVLIKVTPAGSTTAATVLTIDSTGITAAVPLKPYPQTEAQLKVSTPTAVGMIWYDSTNAEFVQSTGTASCLDYAKIEDPTAAPDGW